MSNKAESQSKKVAVVVGASGDIGSAIVRALVAREFIVCGTYYQHKPARQEANSFVYRMDASDEANVQSVWHNIRQTHGAIDVVVFAPTRQMSPKPFSKLEWKNFEEHMNVQVKGFFAVVQNNLEQMRANHKIKFIVVLTEYCLGAPPASLADYITAKYGLLGLAKCLAIDLAKYGTTVNMVSPGMVDTKLLNNLPSKLKEIVASKNPLRRLALVEDVAVIISFLSSEEADYLNGVNIPINGGSAMS